VTECCVLHVEDDDAAACLFRLALDKADIRTSVYRVTDGHHALDFLAKSGPYRTARSPDLIILDLNLPQVDGWTVLRELRKLDNCRSMPVIIISTTPRSVVEARALASGAQGYIEKGFSLDSFLAEVKERCGPFLKDQAGAARQANAAL
jgi:chemotaxis family two-component system response regulator Rcp1